mmetsp:Transcript_31465/g.50964  ORF Transcript_31465/g.50964 Transcript_31465/m.50964 type:complete len:270 (+) Transcript_31465:992-1801(+)
MRHTQQLAQNENGGLAHLRFAVLQQFDVERRHFVHDPLIVEILANLGQFLRQMFAHTPRVVLHRGFDKLWHNVLFLFHFNLFRNLERDIHNTLSHILHQFRCQILQQRFRVRQYKLMRLHIVDQRDQVLVRVVLHHGHVVAAQLLVNLEDLFAVLLEREHRIQRRRDRRRRHARREPICFGQSIQDAHRHRAHIVDAQFLAHRIQRLDRGLSNHRLLHHTQLLQQRQHVLGRHLTAAAILNQFGRDLLRYLAQHFLFRRQRVGVRVRLG